MLLVICLQIIDVNNQIVSEIEKFLLQIDTINEVESEILNLGYALKDEEKNEIVGYITYEKYSEYGLIRYFIFQKILPIHYIFEMFEKLKEKAALNKIESFIAIAKSKEVVELFQKLEFYDISNSNFLVNGQNLLGTDLEDAVVLKYDLNNLIRIQID